MGWEESVEQFMGPTQRALNLVLWEQGRRCFGVSLKSAAHKATCIQIFYLRQVFTIIVRKVPLTTEEQRNTVDVGAFGRDVEVLQISNRPQMW